MKVFPERFKQRGEIYPECGWECGWVASSSGRGTFREEKGGSELGMGTPLCLLAKREHHLSSCFMLLRPHFPAMTDCTLKL